MVPDLKKPRVTEIHVRMDCNGCVQKVKKALNGISGIYDIYIDFPQQKITMIGWADPEKIVKAIQKTRKMATICNIEQHDESPSQPTEEPSSQPKEPDQPEGNSQVPEATQPAPTPTESPPAQIGPSDEPPKETPLPEQPQPEATPALTENNACTSGTKDVGDVHVIHNHLPPNYGNRSFGSGHSYVGYTNSYHNGPVFLHEPPQPVYVTQSYNTYRPSPYVTEYEYVRSPPTQHYTHNIVWNTIVVEITTTTMAMETSHPFSVMKIQMHVGYSR